ncbi:hypothetical protein M569_03571 [Genlisea aurea]|uniref:Cytochrome P450 n=1 Tax=Genlisea aurea TaxID=192259 RepID=S8CWI8_9LAMI|nr:hypothetical protein M569_03571 [Genlisea aurea]
MEETNHHLLLSAAAALVVVLLRTAWRLINWAYLRPKHLESILRKQGIDGNRYNLVYGDMKEAQRIIKGCTGDHHQPGRLRYQAQARRAGDRGHPELTGDVCFYWVGPTPTVVLNDSEIGEGGDEQVRISTGG